jgi:capsule biosynthesis phosphatase
MTSLLEQLNSFDLSGKVVCFDLDHTLCCPGNAKDSYGKYAMAEPIPEMIAKLRLYKSRGCSIIIFTARRMLTHKGDVRKVVEDIGQITEDWLKKHDVPYDDLIFGKPYYDYIIDDKAVNPEQL